jgi:hypothetical protein
MTAVLSNVIADAYNLYTKNCNVPEAHRYLIAMKSECVTRCIEIYLKYRGKILYNNYCIN